MYGCSYRYITIKYAENCQVCQNFPAHCNNYIAGEQNVHKVMSAVVCLLNSLYH